MTHLYIELNTGLTEEVSSSIISKLYELAISGDLDNTSDLKGRLHSTTARDIHVAYLNETFDDLYINADTLYITFVDPEVERVLATKYGDGTNVTTNDMSSVTFINDNTGFSNNQVITLFPELKKFTNLINLNHWAFLWTTNLTTIDLTNIQHIGGLAFYGSGITGIINLPNIVSFGDSSETGSFGQCTNITEVNIGSNFNNDTLYMKSIFSDCTSLTKVTGLSNITGIPEKTFRNCSSLSDVDIDWSKITTVKNYAFEGCSTMPFGELSIPNLVNIESGAFKNCLGLTKLTGLNNFTSIPNDIFEGCSNLTTVDIDWSKITEIGQYAFHGCSNISLSNISIPNLVNIESGVFWNSGILSINNLGSITTIRSDTFNNCSQLTSLKIPNTVTNIYHNAFKNCKNLQETYDLSNVTFIEYGSFGECNKVVISNFPRIATYPSNCFYGIGNTSITIPKEVTTLENGVFWSCKNLTQVTFESPCNITTISIDLFNNCTSLQSIIIPEGITTVNRNCFYGCTSLLSIEFPSTVTTFSGRLGYNLLSLQSITVKATTPPLIDSDTLPGGNYTIYVPASSVSAYQSATRWSSVASKIQAIST